MNSPLNKLPVLDKGYVALVSSTFAAKDARTLYDEYFKGQTPQGMAQYCTAAFAIKMPLFVQINISKFNIKLLDTMVGEVEAYVPHEGEIGSKDLESNRLIADDIKRTTEALLINPHAYVKDGCNNFTAQVIMPISIYNTVIATGSLSDWYKFCNQSSVPKEIKAYMTTIKNLIKAEWEHG